MDIAPLTAAAAGAKRVYGLTPSADPSQIWNRSEGIESISKGDRSVIRDRLGINRNAINEGATPWAIRVDIPSRSSRSAFAPLDSMDSRNPFISATVTESRTHYLRRHRRRGLLEFTLRWWRRPGCPYPPLTPSLHSTPLRGSVHTLADKAPQTKLRGEERETTDHAHNGILCAPNQSQAVLGLYPSAASSRTTLLIGWLSTQILDSPTGIPHSWGRPPITHY